MISTPVPSPALDELATAAHAAQVAYFAKLDTYRKQHFADRTGEAAEKHAAARFAATETGGVLAEAFVTTQRQHRAAMDLGEHVTIGGTTFAMRDLSAAARAAVYRTAAEYGTVDDWPAEVRTQMIALLRSSPRPPTYGEAAETRRRQLANLVASVDQVLSEHGLDPTAWPAERIDTIALAEMRVAAFDRLVNRARGLHSEWSTIATKDR